MKKFVLALGVLALSRPALADDPPADQKPPETDPNAGVQFPEDTGQLPRAGMPEGGASKNVDDRVDPEDKGSKFPLVLDWEGYLRVTGNVVEDDVRPFIGRNDGFQMADARLGLSARYGDSWQAYISIDGALAQSQGANDPNAELLVGLRDAYLEYSWATWLSVRAGRFKVPYDLSDLESTGERTFIEQSVESAGVGPTRGIEVRGLRQGRQMGVMIHRPRMKLTENAFDIGYAVALTNGNTGDKYFNDNDAFAGFARVSLHWGDYVSIHGAGFIDQRTSGELPNLFDENVWGVEGSLELHLADLRIEGQFLLQNTEFETTGIEAIQSMGFHAQFAYRFYGFEVGYRYAWYDPNERFSPDQVSEHTVIASYFFSAVPVRLSLSGTLADEELDVSNNRIEALAQYTF